MAQEFKIRQFKMLSQNPESFIKALDSELNSPPPQTQFRFKLQPLLQMYVQTSRK